MDTLVLAEMEYNGLKYDIEESNLRADKLKQELANIEQQLKDILGVTINWNSPYHISAVLYGGVLKSVEETPYEHTFKTGQRAGQTVTRTHKKEIETTLPRLVEPLEGSDLKELGYWSTDDSTLKRLRLRGSAKSVVGLITKRNELERLSSTYYVGFPKKAREMDWPEGELHGQLNQCVVVTGRLSSSGPNIQNMPPEVDELVTTRYCG
jgi:DNA polymerase-1